MKSRIKKLLIAVLIVTIASQVYIDVLIAEFRVTGAVVAIGIILYFRREIHPVVLGIIVSMSTYIWRVGLFMVTRGIQFGIIDEFAPEILFYLLFCVVFLYLSKKNTIKKISSYFLVMFFSDLTANVIEILIHFILFDENLTGHVFYILPVVAIIRSSLVCLCIKGGQYYQMLVLVEEHEDRYNKLVWLSLNLKSEVYWMAKNMDKIEETMSHAYKLFENIQNNHDPDSWANHSVELAGNVHEIKKDYELIMRGVTEITEFRFQDKGMRLNNIMKLMETKIRSELHQKDFHIDFNITLGPDFYTNKHYQLMSIFRNLFMNAIDAIDDHTISNHITYHHIEAGDHHVFIIEDTGSGIKESEISEIFTPGFSTKINYETGAINRGLGLSFVKDLIEKTLKGSIIVESKVSKGTKFTISIPKSELEV